jgi:hypothetical protein
MELKPETIIGEYMECYDRRDEMIKISLGDLYPQFQSALLSVERLESKVKAAEKALKLINSIYVNHPNAGTLEMPQIADLLYNPARDYLASYKAEVGGV